MKFWRSLVGKALATKTPTPFYLFSAEPVREALDELRVLGPDVSERGSVSRGPIPIRHWLSCKTQPVASLLRWWRRQGRGIEVVSEFEFLAARCEGFAVDNILINGPAKHHWLPRHALPGLRVNFDSLTELRALLPLAKRQRWRCGVRLRTSLEHDPENPKLPTQFGLESGELVRAIAALRRASIEAETLHFHLRTNVPSAAIYERAIREASDVCRAAKFRPLHLDCGGGLPPPFTWSPEGREFAAGWRSKERGLQAASSRGGLKPALRYDLAAFGEVLQSAAKIFPGLQEIWLENGRFLTARSGVLVVRVLDVKERRGLRQLICDGGRTMNALVSNWEQHEVFPVPEGRGTKSTTAVCGPTCMAFDELARCPLPRSVRRGDRLVWMEAGAYHIPWETRFSHGLAPVLWHEDGKLRIVRERESFAKWWGQWK
jgi:diaminopimelate decarboxylase